MAKILIVDDDKRIVEMLEIGLSSIGYEIIPAYDGESAVALVHSEVPDIILLDINLPKKDGFQVCRQIREEVENNYIPIIMITARDDLSSKVEGLDTGADDYITKPVDIKELMARVKSMLRIKNLQDELRSAKDELQELAVRDYLTNCYNRRYFMEIFQLELKKAARYKRDIVCIMLDLDRFKHINDTYGHPAGDKILCALAELMKSNLRDSDIIGRYGGEEFIFLLPQITQKEQLQYICERLRSVVETTPFKVDNTDVFMTASIGAAIFHADSLPTVDDMIDIVDKALYQAKNEGRNCYRIIDC
ncbi:MAG: diguanylate cyclase [Candidatus Auribacterota bacterium]|jgi:diguanylate cyclase (GGDEF)-like protein|nr:diguanylate cyclase [Candidatus Auribacterota bacterium]